MGLAGLSPMLESSIQPSAYFACFAGESPSSRVCRSHPDLAELGSVLRILRHFCPWTEVLALAGAGQGKTLMGPTGDPRGQ
jgi:hypothetical protein